MLTDLAYLSDNLLATTAKLLIFFLQKPQKAWF